MNIRILCLTIMLGVARGSFSMDHLCDEVCQGTILATLYKRHCLGGSEGKGSDVGDAAAAGEDDLSQFKLPPPALGAMGSVVDPDKTDTIVNKYLREKKVVVGVAEERLRSLQKVCDYKGKKVLPRVDYNRRQSGLRLPPKLQRTVSGPVQDLMFEIERLRDAAMDATLAKELKKLKLAE